MKVKMIEHYQDARQHLAPEQVVEVDDELGAWLVEHRKAQAVGEVKQARHLDLEPQFEQAEEPPKPPQFEKPKRSRRSG
jgi:hypothetical protein